MDFLNVVNTFDHGIFENTNYFGLTQGMAPLKGSSSSLILDEERGELVTRAAAAMATKHKVANPDKALLALRNHSEAERRRRERINGHLSTLRTLIPGTEKMDKAALLAEVINKVKELQRGVAEATNGTLVPTDTDEVKVEEQHLQDAIDNGTCSFSVRASLCCDFKHELLSDLREALEALPFNMVSAEIATLGSRMVNVFVISQRNEGVSSANDGGGGQPLVDSVRQALRSVLDKFYASEEFSSRNALSGKRRRVSFIGSSSSSPSLGDHIW